MKSSDYHVKRLGVMKKSARDVIKKGITKVKNSIIGVLREINMESSS